MALERVKFSYFQKDPFIQIYAEIHFSFFRNHIVFQNFYTSQVLYPINVIITQTLYLELADY
jgi:hypothetical protein